MTVFEAEGKLYDWFLKNHTFILDNDFLKLVSISEDEERDKAVISKALENFKEYKVIDCLAGSRVWMLFKPLQLINQNISISANDALTISNLLNEFNTLIGNNYEACNPSNIINKDIENLIAMAQFFLNNSKSVDED